MRQAEWGRTRGDHPWGLRAAKTDNQQDTGPQSYSLKRKQIMLMTNSEFAQP